MSDIPVSSMSMVPLTDETRQALLDAGLGEDRISGLSEMGGQSLLLLHQHVNDGAGAHAPDCYQKGYNPASAMCAGCVYGPRCWRNDDVYLDKLRAGSAGEPPGVPSHVVAARLSATKADRTPAPPARAPGRGAVPPPPPALKRKVAPPPPPSPRKK